MGAGKTAVGRRLARDLGLEFFDSDAEIEARTGVDIGFIFEKEGEQGFRRRERAMIDELTALNGIVLATGGGAILDAENRRRLSAGGTVVYLQASVAQQSARVRHGKERPMLQDKDPEEALQALMEIREPLYLELADLVVETDRRKVATVANDIETQLREGQ